METSSSKAFLLAAREDKYEELERIISDHTIINFQDKNGDTLLHIAAKYGYVTAAALLVAHGAELEIENKEGHVPLYFAVMDKNPTMVEMLLRFGLDPSVTKWQWPDNNISTKENKILTAFDRHCHLVPGLRNGLITKQMFYVNPNNVYDSDYLQIELETAYIKSPFVLLCYKMKIEYSEIKYQLKEEESILSDVYEIGTWNCKDDTIVLFVAVNVSPAPNLTLQIICIDNCSGRIISEQGNKELQKTYVKVSIDVRNGEYQKFMIGYMEKTDTFLVPSVGVNLYPEIMPGSEIFVKEGTFTKDTTVTLKTIDTTEINQECDKLVMLSDILVLNISDDKLPQKELNMAIPMKTGVPAGVAILTSCPEDSQSDGDWSLIEPLNVSDVGIVRFQLKPGFQLSLIVVVSRSVITTGSRLDDIKTALERKIEKQNIICFLIFAKELSETDCLYGVVVHCVVCTKQRIALVNWNRVGYRLLGSSKPLKCRVNSTFQIVLSGNIENIFQNRVIDLGFYLYRENVQMFDVCSIKKELKAEGKITIQQVSARPSMETATENQALCFACGGSRPQTTRLEQTNTLFSLTLTLDHKDRKIPIVNLFDGFKLIRRTRTNKIVPVE